MAEETVHKHLSVSNKFMFLGTNDIPQLFIGNLRPTALLVSLEKLKNEKGNRSPALKKKKKGLKDTENFRTGK